MRARSWAFIILILLPALGRAESGGGEAQVGKVQVPKDVTIRLRHSLTGSGEPAVLVRGGYTIEGWSIARTDEQGAAWTCNASVPQDKSVLDIAAGSDTQLAIGEPLVSTLTAVKRGPVVTFSHRLQGRLGETISIEKNGARSEPPRLRIHTADGSYDQTLSFAYG